MQTLVAYRRAENEYKKKVLFFLMNVQRELNKMKAKMKMKMKMFWPAFF